MAALLIGCSRSAPQLPASYGPPQSETSAPTTRFSAAELAMTCAEVDDAMQSVSNRMAALDSTIASKHGDNQLKGYLAGALFPPLALAMDNSDAEKSQLDQVQVQKDRLIALKRIKGCGSGTETEDSALPSAGKD